MGVVVGGRNAQRARLNAQRQFLTKLKGQAEAGGGVGEDVGEEWGLPPLPPDAVGKPVPPSPQAAADALEWAYVGKVGALPPPPTAEAMEWEYFGQSVGKDNGAGPTEVMLSSTLPVPPVRQSSSVAGDATKLPMRSGSLDVGRVRARDPGRRTVRSA